jgi:DNA-directed RNA polymerase subunit RPC12/RpoP
MADQTFYCFECQRPWHRIGAEWEFLPGKGLTLKNVQQTRCPECTERIRPKV